MATSPIPAGSCVVTGQFGQALTITGKETKDIVVEVSLSTNKNFEVVDMGIRGLIPRIK